MLYLVLQALNSCRKDSAVNKVVQQIGALPSFSFGASLDDGF